MVDVSFHTTLCAEELFQYVKDLAALGPRHAATDNEAKAIEYIERRLKSFGGLAVCRQKTDPIICWKERDSRLRVLEPLEQELTCRAILGCASTPASGVTGHLVYGGRGFPSDYEGLNLSGAVVLHDPPHARTLDNRCGEGQPQRDLSYVRKEGVRGLIEYARLPGRFVQAPLLAGRSGLPLPAVSVTYEDGLFLKELLNEWYAVPDGIIAHEKFPVKVWMWVDVETKESFSYNVIAKRLGKELPREKVVLVAHHDNAFGPGSCDNAASVAVLIGLGKALTELPEPKRTIELVSVTGEEYGQAGSSDYVRQCLASDEKIKACLVLDLIGSGDKYYYVTKSLYEGRIVENSEELNSLVSKVAQALGFSLEPTILEFASDDGPFIEAGIPTTYLTRCISKSWPWLHTHEDKPDVIDPNALKIVSEICLNALLVLANES